MFRSGDARECEGTVSGIHGVESFSASSSKAEMLARVKLRKRY
jgi:hypothetical protein